MRVRANNDIRAPVRNFLSQRTLGVGGSMTAFNTPVYTHNNDIRLLACKLDLLLDHILLAGINNIGGSIGRRGEAVRRLRIGQISDAHALLFLDGNVAVIRFACVQARGDHVVRHVVPETERCCDTLSAFVVGVVV